MRFISVLSFIGILALSIASCNLGSIDDPIVISDVEKEFYVDFRESLTAPDRQLFLDIRTIENEPCLNTSISANLNRQVDGFNISISHIVEPQDCQLGEAPASTTLNLGSTGIRTYDFAIDLKNTIYNLGKLRVEEKRYIVEMETEEGIIFLHDELIRVPNQTVWGFVASEDTDLVNSSLNFVGDLKNLGNEKIYLKGFYHYFTINNDNSIEVNHQKVIDRGFVHSFIFEYTQDQSTIVDKLEVFRSENPEADVYFFTAQGEEW
ncbi:MAG: hypothetical protein DHS20C18_34510 [Saprospiraceae bacterium]|nr:MAG: hypothetical protein DHS20C18_34510 [Saprospiraceae bacterium]